MRLLILIFAIAFAIYGFMPYHKATNIDITKPNQIIIQQQECGCPCPDAQIIKGQILIPDEISIKYQRIHTSQINLDITGFNEPYNHEIGHAKLFITGNVVGADTILCEPTNCEIAPRFKVERWALVDNVAKAWTFPPWAALAYLINLIVLLPTLAIIEISNSLKYKKKRSKLAASE